MSDPGEVYNDLAFPEPPTDRPYVFINMVTTIDGKTVTGDRTEDVLDLGSKVDHTLMRRIEDRADAVLIGANTLRAASKKWDPGSAFRIVVSGSGEVDYDLPFFQAGGKGFVATSENTTFQTKSGVERLEAGKDKLDFVMLLQTLREMGVKRMLCFGGSELNAQLLERDLVDELFLTIAPKVKLGREVPTYAGGHPLPREKMLTFHLLDSHVFADEVFLRYRRQTPTVGKET
ncbi:MAG: hypothetical protein QOJ65_175 [Fimbriimonadaceae bacterium]|nr:hypothetical protein [Fimbriimonadaceae bacterium]